MDLLVVDHFRTVAALHPLQGTEKDAAMHAETRAFVASSV
jgi:hypothetical protein